MTTQTLYELIVLAVGGDSTEVDDLVEDVLEAAGEECFFPSPNQVRREVEAYIQDMEESGDWD